MSQFTEPPPLHCDLWSLRSPLVGCGGTTQAIGLAGVGPGVGRGVGVGVGLGVGLGVGVGVGVGRVPVPEHNSGSSSEPSAQLLMLLHVRSPSMQAP